MDTVHYNSQSILPHMISFLPHTNPDTLVSLILYSASSKVEAAWENLSDSHMDTQFMVADSGRRQKFSDINYRLSVTCALVRRLKTYISSRFNVYHNFVKCQICENSSRWIHTGYELILLLDQSISWNIFSAGHDGVKWVHNGLPTWMVITLVGW